MVESPTDGPGKELYFGFELPTVPSTFPERERQAVTAFYAELTRRLTNGEFRFEMSESGHLMMCPRLPDDYTIVGDDPAQNLRHVHDLFQELEIASLPGIVLEPQHFSPPQVDQPVKDTRHWLAKSLSRLPFRHRDPEFPEPPAVSARRHFFDDQFCSLAGWFHDCWVCGYAVPAIVQWHHSRTMH